MGGFSGLVQDSIYTTNEFLHWAELKHIGAPNTALLRAVRAYNGYLFEYLKADCRPDFGKKFKQAYEEAEKQIHEGIKRMTRLEETDTELYERLDALLAAIERDAFISGHIYSGFEGAVNLRRLLNRNITMPLAEGELDMVGITGHEPGEARMGMTFKTVDVNSFLDVLLWMELNPETMNAFPPEKKAAHERLRERLLEELGTSTPSVHTVFAVEAALLEQRLKASADPQAESGRKGLRLLIQRFDRKPLGNMISLICAGVF